MRVWRAFFGEFRFAPSQAILGQLEFYESLLSEQFCGLSLLCDQIAFGLPLISRASSFGGELAFFFELGLRELMRPFQVSRDSRNDRTKIRFGLRNFRVPLTTSESLPCD